jgi:tetratricopeptide (TPR) repeat protein
MAVSLPIFFFLYDYITGRMQRLRQLLYLAPFFACSLLFSIISIVRVSNAALSPDKTLPLPLGEKLILLVAEIGFYFTRPFGFWQQHLTYLIPPAGSLAHAPQLVLYSILGVIVAGLFLYIIAILKDKLMTSLILGWLAFLSPILQLYPNTHSYVSERYFYISIIFPVFILYRLASPVIRKWQPWFYALIAIFCFWSVLRSHGRSRDWRNSETLFSHEIAVNPENSLAYNSLAQYYNTNGRFPDAMILLQKALELEPNNPYYLTNLGWALGATGHTDLAIDMLSKAIAIRGDIVQAYNNLAVCYVFKNDDHKALDCLSAAYKIDPKNSDILYNLGICYSRAGMEETALIYFKRASQLGNRTAERFAK